MGMAWRNAQESGGERRWTHTSLEHGPSTTNANATRQLKHKQGTVPSSCEGTTSQGGLQGGREKAGKTRAVQAGQGQRNPGYAREPRMLLKARYSPHAWGRGPERSVTLSASSELCGFSYYPS